MDGEQRRNGDNNSGGSGSLTLVFSFPMVVLAPRCLPALLIVSLVYRGIPVARAEPGLTIRRSSPVRDP